MACRSGFSSSVRRSASLCSWRLPPHSSARRPTTSSGRATSVHERPMPRTTALAVIRDADRLLLSEVPDAVKNVVGYRPLGGTIEFGERGHETVAREIREEIGA